MIRSTTLSVRLAPGIRHTDTLVGQRGVLEVCLSVHCTYGCVIRCQPAPLCQTFTSCIPLTSLPHSQPASHPIHPAHPDVCFEEPENVQGHAAPSNQHPLRVCATSQYKRKKSREEVKERSRQAEWKAISISTHAMRVFYCWRDMFSFRSTRGWGGNRPCGGLGRGSSPALAKAKAPRRRSSRGT